MHTTAISIATLKTLATSPNPSIANAAISLIVARFLASRDACKSFSDDLDSPHHETGRRARLAASFLQDYSSLSDHATLPWEIPGFSHGNHRGDETDNDGFWTPSLVPRLIDAGIDDSELDLAAVPRQRQTSGDDTAELERRRLRREAMVLHEGDGIIAEEATSVLGRI